MKRFFLIMWSICIVYFSLVVLNSYISVQEAAVYRQGSRGTVVREIQRRLKNWGYYRGNVDGIYGRQTTSAVRSFQSKNGLAVDGIAGNRTLSALGINPNQGGGTPAAGSQNMTLLTRAINGEARGEPYIGQVAVGGVIMNRVRDPRFPGTIAGVVYQPGAFTAIADGQIHANLEESPRKAAIDAMNGWDPSGGAVYYYNPAKTTNKWIWSRPVIKVIGKHRFCK